MGACIPSRQSKPNNPTSNTNQQTYSSPTYKNQASNHKKTRLSTNFNDNDQYFQKHIDNLNHRKRLNLANLQLIDSDMQQLIKCSWLNTIEELNLQNNYLTNEGYELLCSKKWPKLRVINLAVNNIREITGESHKGLEQFPQIQIAYFQRNPLSQKSKQMLRVINGKNGVFLCWTQDN